MSFPKEKSWSVKLVDGYVLNSQIRANRCKGCDYTSKLLVSNNGNPDLLLYGCNTHKCRHILIRMKFSEVDQAVLRQPDISVTSAAELQEIVHTV